MAVGSLLALAGCGSNSSGSPAQTIGTFLRAAAAADGAKACAQLSVAAQRQVVTGAWPQAAAVAPSESALRLPLSDRSSHETAGSAVRCP